MRLQRYINLADKTSNSPKEFILTCDKRTAKRQNPDTGQGTCRLQASIPSTQEGRTICKKRFILTFMPITFVHLRQKYHVMKTEKQMAAAAAEFAERWQG